MTEKTKPTTCAWCGNRLSDAERDFRQVFCDTCLREAEARSS